MKLYLPKWKIYFWKKLLLNNEKFDEGRVITHNFMFFTDTEQRQLMIKENQRTIDSIQNAYGVALARKKAMEIDISIDDNYYSFRLVKIMGELVELMDDKPYVLSVTAQLDKRYITWYQKTKREYEALQYKKHIASLGFSRGSGPYEPNSKYMNDPFCGLGETIYKKTEAEEILTPDEFKKLAGFAYSSTYEYLLLELKINKTALQAKLSAYLDDFMAGNLVPPQGVRYFKFDQQKDKIFSAIQSLTTQYGNKNIAITFEEIARQGGWEDKDEHHYRFYETLFALEKNGEIEIKDLRKSEVIISLIEKFEIPKKKLSVADKKKLYILEKLKEEWDLVPKHNSGATMIQTSVLIYTRPSGEVRISSQEYSSWKNESGIGNYNQLENILGGFQNDGLITEWEFINEFR